MTVHLIKLCVGAQSMDDLAVWQRQHTTRHSPLVGRRCAHHTTRQTPKRQSEVLDGGSIFWVIKGIVHVRQHVLGFDSVRNTKGQPCCALVLDPELVPVEPVPRRAFQGWRYLDADDAPADLSASSSTGVLNMPVKLRQELAALCLL